jgi:hypothetical protein
MKQIEKFKKINMDTASAEKINETNEKLVKYLKDSGEVSTIDQVEYLIKNQNIKKNQGKLDSKNSTYEKILITDKKILNVLSNIHRDMIDEQDTSIKQTSRNGGANNTENLSSMLMSSVGESGFDIPDARFKSRKRSKQKNKKTKVVNKPKVANKPKVHKIQKTSSVVKGISKAVGGVGIAKGVAGAAKKTSSVVNGMGKSAKNLIRLAKGVPLLGVIAAAGMAIYDGVEGYNNASDILGIPEDELTQGDKTTAAASSIVSGLTFGLVESSSVAKGIQNLTGGNDVIDIMTESGIIDHDYIGDSEVDDWFKLSQLPSNKIDDIIKIDDWSNDDLNLMEELKEVKKLEESTKQSTSATVPMDETIDTEKIINSIEKQIVIFEKAQEDTSFFSKNKYRDAIESLDNKREVQLTKHTKEIEISKIVNKDNVISEIDHKEPKKTSDITLRTPKQKTRKEVMAEASSIEPNKIIKENITDTSNKNLTKQVIKYENNKTENSTSTLINTNTNNIIQQNVGQEKILNIFSAGV